MSTRKALISTRNSFITRQKQIKMRETYFVNLQVGIHNQMGKMMMNLKMIAISRSQIQALLKTQLKPNRRKKLITKKDKLRKKQVCLP